MKRTTPASEEDVQWVEAFQDRSDPEGAFQALFERYGPMTYAFFKRRIGSHELAAEQNQELYMAVLENLDGFRKESSFRTWLFCMAQNRLRHLRRRLRIHTDEWTQEAPDALWDGLSESSDGPQLQLEEADRGRRLRRCIAELPETERAVVIGQYYQENTLREMTAALRLTNRSGARALLIAAQRKLRTCLERAGVSAGGAS